MELPSTAGLSCSQDCGWIQWLGQRGNRNSGKTALLSASDHPVQPLPASPPLLWGLLTLTEKALGAQRESFSIGRDKLPSISVQGHCHQSIFSCSPSCLKLLGLVCRAAVGDFPSPGRLLSPVQKRQPKSAPSSSSVCVSANEEHKRK